MKLLVQPEDGPGPLLRAVGKAATEIYVVIFRFDLRDLEVALAKAVARGVPVHALIANTNHGGEKLLRKLEQRLLDAGIQVARTADDLARYHGKVLIADKTVFVLGFNYTRLDIERSRGFGLVSDDARLVKAAIDLFQSDSTRQPYKPSDDRLVVSPENSRDVLADFIRGAKRSLAIYEINISDGRMLKLLAERIKAGVEVRVIGKIRKPPDGMGVRKLARLRPHARAIVRDGTRAFVGSQSLKRAELDKRREVGLIVTDPRIARRLQQIFEADWDNAKPKQEPEPVVKPATKGNGKSNGKSTKPLSLVAS